MKKALVFLGQGAQFVGMGKELTKVEKTSEILWIQQMIL